MRFFLIELSSPGACVFEGFYKGCYGSVGRGRWASGSVRGESKV